MYKSLYRAPDDWKSFVRPDTGGLPGQNAGYRERTAHESACSEAAPPPPQSQLSGPVVGAPRG